MTWTMKERGKDVTYFLDIKDPSWEPGVSGMVALLEKIVGLVRDDGCTSWDTIYLNLWPDSGRLIACAGLAGDASKRGRSRFGCQLYLQIIDQLYHQLRDRDISDAEFDHQHDMLVFEVWRLLEMAVKSPTVHSVLAELRQRQPCKLLRFLYTDQDNVVEIQS